MKGVLVLMLTLTMTSCASVARFNKVTADVTHEAIVASEQNRCTVHAKPCLGDAEFKEVNVHLTKISVAGREFTKLEIAGTASAKDAQTFLSVVAEETGILSKTFTDGSIAKVLAALTKLQLKAAKLLG